MSQSKEEGTLSLSLVISLKDNFTQELPVGKVTVTLKDEPYKAVKNPSGFYLFLKLPTKIYTVQIRSSYYFDQDQSVTFAPVDSKKPMNETLTQIVKVIGLEPTPAYPFPNGATLLRGIVTNQDEKPVPVPNANVALVEKAIETSTTEKGEYVFYFPNLTNDDVIKKDGIRYLKPRKNSKNTTLTIQAENKGSAPQKVTVDGVEEGTSIAAPAIKLYTTS
jgi:hypothetical protein